MKLRPARPEDAPAIAKVHVQSWRETYPGIISAAWLSHLSLPARVAAWTENLSPHYKGPRFNIVAEDESQGIVGFASGGPQRHEDRPAGPARLERFGGELWALYLLKACQGKGTGRALFEDIRGRLKQDGCASMLVWVLKGNPSEKFYSRMGGNFAGSRKITIDREHEELAYGWEKI